MNDRDARAAWSALAEPTDPVARALITEFGPARALQLALQPSVHQLHDAIRHAAESPSADEIAVEAADRSALRAPSLEIAERAHLRWCDRAGSVRLEDLIDDADRAGIGFLTPEDDSWPGAVEDLGVNAPYGLWMRGSASPADLLTARPTVAIVGARAATAYGAQVAGDLALGAAERGITVVSGGAYGIDAAAHRGALSAGQSLTCAVLAGGLDRFYPRGNEDLLRAVERHALILSEAPMFTAPTRWRFLARNRIIAALSAATVVVEAALRSGALSTANRADDLSRPVAAVPGPVTSPASAGCHRLARENGAVLITDADELAELVTSSPASDGTGVVDELDLLSAADRRVLDAVPPRSVISCRAAARDCGLGVDAVQAALQRIAMLGLVELTGSGVRRRL